MQTSKHVNTSQTKSKANRTGSSTYENGTGQEPNLNGFAPQQSTLQVKLDRLRNNTPDELKQLAQWVVWRLVPNEDPTKKPDKVPYCALHPTDKASTTDPGTWASFDQAIRTYQKSRDKRYQADGIGFVLAEGDPYVFIDIDGLNDDIAPDPRRSWLAVCASYAELSQSGKGIHILVRGKLPPNSGHKNSSESVEIYARARMCAFTADVLPGYTQIADGQIAVNRFLARYFPKKPPKTEKRKTSSTGSAITDAPTLWEKMFTSKSAPKIRKLYDGDPSDYLDREGKPDDSSADQALCSYLAWWTNCNRPLMDTMFRESGLYRSDKWERDSYRDPTLDFAIAHCEGGYQAPGDKITLEDILGKLDQIKLGIEGTPLGDQIGYLTGQERRAVASAMKVKGLMDFNAAQALVARCYKEIGKRKTEALKGDRPMIETVEQPLDMLREAAIKALNEATGRRPAYPVLYTYSNELTRIVRGENAHYRMQNLAEGALPGLLADVALWTYKGQPMQPPPKSVVGAVYHRGGWDFPVLEKVVHHPTFAPNGNLSTQEGYSRDTGLFYSGGVTLGDTAPTPGNVEAAKQLIQVELYGDFPFVDDASKANMLAGFLLPYMYPLIDDITPCHVGDAPTQGTGKTKALNLISLVSDGESAKPIAACIAEDDWRKSLSSALREGRNYIFIDNIPTGQGLDSPSFSSYITSKRPSERLLGHSEHMHLKNNAIWLASGNNFTGSAEALRRSIWIRMDANMEHPENRDKWKHEKVEAWALGQRDQLITAAITLCRAWVDNGMRPWKGKTKGSFERWAEVMGGILNAVGVEGFLDNEDELWEVAQSAEDGMVSFVQMWHEKFKLADMLIEDLFPLASHYDTPTVIVNDKQMQTRWSLGLLDQQLRSNKEQGRKVSLGKLLGKYKGRVFAGYKIMKGGLENGKQKWRLEVPRLSEGG